MIDTFFCSGCGKHRAIENKRYREGSKVALCTSCVEKIAKSKNLTKAQLVKKKCNLEETAKRYREGKYTVDDTGKFTRKY